MDMPRYERITGIYYTLEIPTEKKIDRRRPSAVLSSEAARWRRSQLRQGGRAINICLVWYNQSSTATYVPLSVRWTGREGFATKNKRVKKYLRKNI